VRVSLNELRRDCAAKRDLYQHAKTVYGEAVRLGLSAYTDMTALRGELEEALVTYYAAHSALHSALARPALATLRLH
jgi:PHP family Zn ribbon phosphoesterase